jgi:hypothetical protein
MITAAKKAIFNRMNSAAKIQGLGTALDNSVGVATVTYDFSVSGGAVSTIDLGKAIPDNAIVTQVVQDTLTTVTSGGSATVQLILGSTNLTGATAIASITGTGTIALASGTAIKVATGANLKVAIATAALTAGKVRFLVTYHISQDN